MGLVKKIFNFFRTRCGQFNKQPRKATDSYLYFNKYMIIQYFIKIKGQIFYTQFSKLGRLSKKSLDNILNARVNYQTKLLYNPFIVL